MKIKFFDFCAQKALIEKLLILLITISFCFPNSAQATSDKKLSIGLVSSYCPSMWPGNLKNLKEKHEVICLCSMHKGQITLDDLSNFDRVIFFENSTHYQLPKELSCKSIFINAEPNTYKKEYYDNFAKVLTWNDDLIDANKFHKFVYPYLTEMKQNVPSFKDKKFMCIIASNWVPHRIDALDFFFRNQNSLDIFGKNLPAKFALTKMYKGPIPGHHSSDQKFQILSRYKFNLCFENTINAPGYITEKIFACFTAGCIPVYWGASNVEEYIPNDCYIDIRNFSNYEQLLLYLSNLKESEYMRYLENIRSFLCSDKGNVFSVKNFQKNFDEIVELDL